MNALEKAKQLIAERLRAVLPPEVAVSVSDLTRPPKPEFGDLAYPCFAASKHFRKAPQAVAVELMDQLGTIDGVQKIEFMSPQPYINFTLDRQLFSTAVLEDVLGRAGEYGDGAATGKQVLIEYGSPNTHKEIHVGHLRNFSVGLANERILTAAGNTVVPVNYLGDVGAHVAKWLWYADKVEKGEVEGMTPGAGGDIASFGKIYTDATRLLESDEEKYKPEVSAVLQALEAHDPVWEKRWLETRDACLLQIDAIFKELGIHFARTYLESEVEGPGKELVKELVAKGIAKEGDKGAIIVDLEDEKLGIFLALKSDGTALYSTKELALAKLKFAEYPGTNESLHVVDNRQSLYFKQFFSVLKRMGFTQPMRHLAHDFVTLAEGAMSSRKGNIVTYEDFRDEMTARVMEETVKRHEDWSPEKQQENAWVIAEGAMKFGMLKQDDDRPIVFDMTAALSFDGFTGPYVQYSYARLSSILAKAGGEVVSVCKASDDPAEFALLRLVAEFPATVTSAAAAYRPSLIAQYLFDLAQTSNAFYRDVPVLSAEPAERCRRLAIVEAARRTLARGLWMLGIRAPEEM